MPDVDGARVRGRQLEAQRLDSVELETLAVRNAAIDLPAREFIRKIVVVIMNFLGDAAQMQGAGIVRITEGTNGRRILI